MDTLQVLLILLVVFFIYNIWDYPTVKTQYLTEKPGSLGFVKPEHRLLKIFTTVSSGTKIQLTGICQKFIYNKNTIDPEVRETIVNILSTMIDSLQHVAKQEYAMRTIENVYGIIDKKGNQRYIVDFFVFDVKNFYTIRLITDIVVFNDDVYLNYLNVQNGSNSTLLNHYDVKFNSSGILMDANMFHENIENMLNTHYSNSFQVIGINSSTQDYSKLDLSEVYSLNSFRNLYFPSNLSSNTIDLYEKKGISGHYEQYLPSDQTTVKNPQFCPVDDWSDIGNSKEKNKNCILHNTATQAMINEPYSAPSVIYERSSNDAYRWLKDAYRGNLMRGAGFSI